MDQDIILHPVKGYQQVSFSGTTATYFPLWLSTAILNILTMGLYSPWAFLRRRNYFLNRTRIGGHGFHFHASPVTLLKARLVTIAIAIVTLIVSNTVPYKSLWANLILLTCMGPIVTGAFQYIATQTSYKDLPFSFHGTDAKAWKAFMLGPLLIFVSLGCLAPFATRWQSSAIVEDTRLGNLTFSVDPPLSKLYKAWGVSAALFALLFALFVWALTAALTLLPDIDYTAATGAFVGFTSITAAYFILLPCSALYCIAASNIIWSSIEFGPGHRVRRHIPVAGCLWLILTNKVASLLSLGLLVPWASIRYQHYVARHTEVELVTESTTIESAAEVLPGSAFYSEFLRLNVLLPRL